ncbi:MAG: phosphoribosyl-ATP diphosphatase [Oscillospiraceae bacterium]
MNNIDVLNGLFDVIKERKTNPQEGSYTCYLFEQGIDKILKKCGEECSEMIIAAKNADKEEISNEMCDLLFHMLVLMAESGVELSDVTEILENRRQKIGNLKVFHKSNHES